ncbi:polysaccharide deacetylase family protein [Brevibacillus parabrevis]|uniref:polysaccharide deacetylase family protein n=1 Tax=Brevibacillus parabrevis TaxID=54914 RepID=UPI0007AB8470|nr:polysaccharide deacetylase family protein [Brevibacillus parabrevis]KZE45027.1 xylanase [Brevibacillus parabrevis]MED1722428.1 polysaccharide deacetylase family protein [Brevibacillus parabrevis]TGV30336.1 xylanase [Mesorhizobium sp. M00.F.Ca.ET.186.01.1.1]
MPNKRLFLTVFISCLLLVVTILGLGDLYQSKKNAQKVQPFPQVDTSISISETENAEPNVTRNEKATVKPQKWYNNQVVVLTYHHVTDAAGQRYVIAPEQFAKHMAFLHENDLHPITLDEFLRFVDTGSLPTENAVLITFDDGYESYYTKAFPILRTYGYPSVNFVIAGRLRDVAERKRENMTTPLTRQQVMEMLHSGLADIGSHTYSLHEEEARNEWGEMGPETAPVYLQDVKRLENEKEYRDRLYVDFSMSRAGLHGWMNKDIKAISLPFGYTNPIVLETARQAGYEYVFTSTPGFAKRGVDPFAIPRNDVGLRDVDEVKLQQLFTKAKKEFEGEQS